MATNTLPVQPLSFLKILAHDLRWQLISVLTQSDYRVQELVNRLQQPQNLISYHLKQLRSLHLVIEHRSTADARDIYYSLDLATLQTYMDEVGQAIYPALIQRVSLSDQAYIPPLSSKRILFLCTENSARSQMAEGILRHSTNEQLEVLSAGTMPTSVHPYAIRVLEDRGIDISQHRAKSVDEFKGHTFDHIITVCDRAREDCPVFPGDSQHIHWSLRDPVTAIDDEARYQAFEHTAQQLVTCIHYFLAKISHEEKKRQ